MSGVVHRPDPKKTHCCAPGLGDGTSGPYISNYTHGTVWECDCGRTWVSRRIVPGGIEWKRESRWARRRRLKRT